MGAVDLGCFVEFAGNALHARQEDDHVATQPAPQRNEDQGEHGGVWIGQPPQGWQAHAGERCVGQSTLRIHNPAPDQGSGCHRGDHRQIERGAEKDAAPD